MHAAVSKDMPYRLGGYEARGVALACEESFRGSPFTRYLLPCMGPANRGIIGMFHFVMREATTCEPTSAIEGAPYWSRENRLTASLRHMPRAGGLSSALRDRGPWGRSGRAIPRPNAHAMNDGASPVSESACHQAGAARTRLWCYSTETLDRPRRRRQ